MKTYRPHLSSIGDAQANTISVLCYIALVFFWNFSILLILPVFFVEKRSGLVRFHAMQAALLWVVRILAGGGLTFEATAAVLTGNVGYMSDPYGWGGPVAVVAVRLGIGALVMVFACSALYHAYRWQDWKIPIVGQLAKGICKKSRAMLYSGDGIVPTACDLDWEDDEEAEEYWPVQVAAAGVELAQAGEIPPRAPVVDERLMLVQGAVPPDPAPAQADTNAALLPALPLPGLDENRGTLTEEELQGAELVDAERDADAPQAQKKRKRKSKVVVLAPDDPNGQLPPEMRDAPVREETAEWYGGAAPEKSAGAGEKRRNETKPVVQSSLPITVSYSEQVWIQDKKASMTEKVLESVLQMNKPVAAPAKAEDPNKQLPPEMRDAPALWDEGGRELPYGMD